MENHFLLFIGAPEIFIIVLVIVMFFGSKKIPEIARGLGQGIREIKNATDDIQREIVDSTKDINKVRDSVNVEKQIKDFIKDKVAENKEPTKDLETSKEDKVVSSSPENAMPRSKSNHKVTPEEDKTA